MGATHDDLADWVWSTTGIMPVTRQPVRKDVQNATLQAGFVGFTTQSSMDHALNMLHQKPWFGGYRITVGVSRDSKGDSKGFPRGGQQGQGLAQPPPPQVRPAARGQQGQGPPQPPAPQVPPAAGKQQGQGPPQPPAPQVPPAAQGQGQGLPQPPGPLETTWVYGRTSNTIVVERDMQTIEIAKVDQATQTPKTTEVAAKDTQTMKTPCVEMEVQTDVSYPVNICIEERDETKTLAPISPTERAHSPTLSSPTHSPSDAPTCLVAPKDEEEVKTEVERQLLQAKQELCNLQRIKEEMDD